MLVTRGLPRALQVASRLCTSRQRPRTRPQTDADTIAVGVFSGEDVAHDLPGGELGALLESGEASTRAFAGSR